MQLQLMPVSPAVHLGIDADFMGVRNQLGLTPEGTRSRTEYWKTGFYYIALTANVPICLAYIDYPSRTIGFGEMLYPSGDIEKDFEIIKTFYQDKTGIFPEKQGAIRIKHH